MPPPPSPSPPACADKPNVKCNENICGKPIKAKKNCKKTCGLCEGLPPSTPPTPPPMTPPPAAQCEGLEDFIKKGTNKCKLVGKCSTTKLTKCKKGCKKDYCKKLNKKKGTCKKSGKRFCLKTCCDALGPWPY